jgi:hypothetical protein
MGLFDRFFKFPAPVQEPPFETVKKTISLDDTGHAVMIKIHGRELFAEDFFQASLEDNDYAYGRFYLLNEALPKTHFAPTLEQAIGWFRGKSAPKDGYNTIVWGEKARYQCKFCENVKQYPLRITTVEKVVVCTALPHYREIVGWRVLEVENEELGPGIPTKILDRFKTYPIIKWHSPKKGYVCQNCAAKLEKLGKDQELADCVIFEPD